VATNVYGDKEFLAEESQLPFAGSEQATSENKSS
jgi:hypothetical protein